ncbi:hypothetical protein DO72_3778 [Burkholderia pseudomallei]|nr:hypothetical protein DO72_3778 [Burkholderia pseudomallei]
MQGVRPVPPQERIGTWNGWGGWSGRYERRGRVGTCLARRRRRTAARVPRGARGAGRAAGPRDIARHHAARCDATSRLLPLAASLARDRRAAR